MMIQREMRSLMVVCLLLMPSYQSAPAKRRYEQILFGNMQNNAHKSVKKSMPPEKSVESSPDKYDDELQKLGEKQAESSLDAAKAEAELEAEVPQTQQPSSADKAHHRSKRSTVILGDTGPMQELTELLKEAENEEKLENQMPSEEIDEDVMYGYEPSSDDVVFVEEDDPIIPRQLKRDDPEPSTMYGVEEIVIPENEEEAYELSQMPVPPSMGADDDEDDLLKQYSYMNGGDDNNDLENQDYQQLLDYMSQEEEPTTPSSETIVDDYLIIPENKRELLEMLEDEEPKPSAINQGNGEFTDDKYPDYLLLAEEGDDDYDLEGPSQEEENFEEEEMNAPLLEMNENAKRSIEAMAMDLTDNSYPYS